ncbi:MAG: sigma-70 family RNA polymerase sigma factor [Candidatus Pacearchaeota archaeon]|jgi:RNA polymerase sigma factor for flagellar operon FliA
MSEQSEKLLDMIEDPLSFYSSNQLKVRGFDRNYRRRLERDECKLAKVSLKGDLSYLGGYLLGRAQKEKLGVRNLLKQKPKNYSYVCPFAFCEAMQVHPDELPETISIDGKSLPLIERVQIKNNLQFRISVTSMAYISLPTIEDIPISDMNNEELVRRHRVSGEESYREEFLTRYGKNIKNMIEFCPSFQVAIEQMGYPVLEHQAKKGASEAFERFDLTRGILLTTYLPRRVKGEVLDYLREIDEVPRNVRNVEKKMNHYMEDARKNERQFDIEEFVQQTGVSREAADLAYELFKRRHGHTLSLDEKQFDSDNFKELRLKDQVIVEVPLSKDSTRLYEVREGISKLLSGLDPLEREMIIAYYFEDTNMKAVGNSLDLSESRVSQMIHGTNGEGGILERLRCRAAQIFPEFIPRELKHLFPD